MINISSLPFATHQIADEFRSYITGIRSKFAELSPLQREALRTVLRDDMDELLGELVFHSQIILDDYRIPLIAADGKTISELIVRARDTFVIKDGEPVWLMNTARFFWHICHRTTVVSSGLNESVISLGEFRGNPDQIMLTVDDDRYVFERYGDPQDAPYVIGRYFCIFDRKAAQDLILGIFENYVRLVVWSQATPLAPSPRFTLLIAYDDHQLVELGRLKTKRIKGIRGELRYYFGEKLSANAEVPRF